jgi:hypothetical protein
MWQTRESFGDNWHNKCPSTHQNGSRDSSVSITTRLWAGRRRNLGSISGRGKKCFSSSQRPDRLWVHMASCSMVPEVKRPGDRADHSPQSTAVVKNPWRKHSWSYTSTSPNVFMLWCLTKHKNNFTLIGFEVLKVLVMKSSVFWDITPFSPLKIIRRFGGTHLLGHQVPLATFFMLIYCLAYYLAPKMEAACSSETSVNFRQTTRRYVPENRIL